MLYLVVEETSGGFCLPNTQVLDLPVRGPFTLIDAGREWGVVADQPAGNRARVDALMSALTRQLGNSPNCTITHGVDDLSVLQEDDLILVLHSSTQGVNGRVICARRAKGFSPTDPAMLLVEASMPPQAGCSAASA